jgi:thymidylate synthase
MAMFKKITVGHIVIMGRKTYDSIGKALSNRVNIVISKQKVDMPLVESTDDSTDGSLSTLSLTSTLTSTLSLTSTSLVFVPSPEDAILYCNKTDHCKGKKRFVIGGETIYRWFMSNNLVKDYHITNINAKYPDCDTRFEMQNAMLNSKLLISQPISDIATYNYLIVKNKEEQSVLDLMRKIITHGAIKNDRTLVGTRSLFGWQLKFSLKNNTFPLMTTRNMFLRGIFEELMLYIRGQTNNKILEDKNITVWRGNTTREFLDSKNLQRLPVGDMGASYGFLFRHFGAEYKTCMTDYTGQGVDQLSNVINTLKTNPDDRRMIISLWDPTNLINCPLPPCLYNYQFYASDGKLSCMMTQRSSDLAVAGGWNIATGALLTYMIAQVCDMTPDELIWNMGDVHIYNNLVSQVHEQIDRVPSPFPKLKLNKKDNITDYQFEDLTLLNYDPQSSIKMVMNV